MMSKKDCQKLIDEIKPQVLETMLQLQDPSVSDAAAK